MIETDSRESCSMKEQGYAELILRFLRMVLIIDLILVSIGYLLPVITSVLG